MSSVDEDSSSQTPEEQNRKMEKDEEEKLKKKYPQISRPGPQFLQKRLQAKQKYFDSGEYQMNLQLGKGRLGIPSALSQPNAAEAGPPSPDPTVTGKTMPTPESLPTRKTSIHIQSKLATGAP